MQIFVEQDIITTTPVPYVDGVFVPGAKERKITLNLDDEAADKVYELVARLRSGKQLNELHNNEADKATD